MVTDSRSCSSACETYSLITNPKAMRIKSHCGLTFFSLSIPFLSSWAFRIWHALFKGEQRTRFIENMWWYNLRILSRGGRCPARAQWRLGAGSFPHTKYGEVLGKRNSKIVSDEHILTVWPINTPENHRNLIRDGFLSHVIANVLRISHSTLISKFQTQIWSLW